MCVYIYIYIHVFYTCSAQDFEKQGLEKHNRMVIITIVVVVVVVVAVMIFMAQDFEMQGLSKMFRVPYSGGTSQAGVLF